MSLSAVEIEKPPLKKRPLARPLRVGLVTGNLETGGMQMLVIELMRLLDRSRFTPVLISLRPRNHFAAEIARNGWEIHTLTMTRCYRPREISALARVIRKARLDLIHAHSDMACFATRAAVAAYGGPPIIAHFHNTYTHRLDEAFKARERLVAETTDLYVACSQGVEEFIQQRLPLGRKPLRLILNGRDCKPYLQVKDRREELRRRFAIPDGVFHVVHTARLEPHKAPERLLDALEAVGPQIGPWIATFVGGGSMRDELESRVNTNPGLFKDGQIRFVGWSEDVASHLGSADAYVLCSRNEGLSLSLVEAMAAGAPCIGPNIIGPQEVLGPSESGILIDYENDPEGLGRALIRLRNNSEERAAFVARGHDRVKAFCLDRFIRETEEAYELVAQKPSHKGLGVLSRWGFLRRFRRP
jgi:glycosyltransferase involved in cell wall biosynthesis